MLKPSKKTYKKVSLYKNGVVNYFMIHRLVASEFIENKNNKPCVNHKNGNKFDNRVENLEWCTHSENSIHALENDLIPNEKNHGYRNGQSVANVTDILVIREIFEEMIGTLLSKYDDLAEVFGLSRTTIFNIIKQNTWKEEYL